MEIAEQIEINTRLGLRKVNRDKIIYFPKGLAGLAGLHEYVLLQIRPETPMLVLQSIQVADMGLIVANPYTFISDYSYKLELAEQKLLCLDDEQDLMIMVTVYIPHGKPEEASLRLTGPILINPVKRIGLQVMQIGNIGLRQFKLKQLMGGEKSNKEEELS